MRFGRIYFAPVTSSSTHFVWRRESLRVSAIHNVNACITRGNRLSWTPTTTTIARVHRSHWEMIPFYPKSPFVPFFFSPFFFYPCLIRSFLIRIRKKTRRRNDLIPSATARTSISIVKLTNALNLSTRRAAERVKTFFFFYRKKNPFRP